MPEDKELKAMESVLSALKDLEDAEKKRVLTWVSEKLKIQTAPIAQSPATGNGAGTASAIAGVSQPASVGSTHLTPSQFMESKQPSNDIERVTCLGFYLTHHRTTDRFKAKQIEDLNTEARQPRMSNVPRAIANATNLYKYFSSVGQGDKQLTSKGDTLVDALPNRELVKALPKLSSKSKRGRSPKSKPKNS